MLLIAKNIANFADLYKPVDHLIFVAKMSKIWNWSIIFVVVRVSLWSFRSTSICFASSPIPTEQTFESKSSKLDFVNRRRHRYHTSEAQSADSKTCV